MMTHLALVLTPCHYSYDARLPLRPFFVRWVHPPCWHATCPPALRCCPSRARQLSDGGSLFSGDSHSLADWYFSCCLHLKHGCAIFVPLLYQTGCFLSTVCLCLKSDYAKRVIYSRPPAVSIAIPDYPHPSIVSRSRVKCHAIIALSVNRLVLSCLVSWNIIALCQSSCGVVSSATQC